MARVVAGAGNVGAVPGGHGFKATSAKKTNTRGAAKLASQKMKTHTLGGVVKCVLNWSEDRALNQK